MFSKSKNNVSINNQSFFPKAEEMIKKSSEYWDERTPQEILDGILRESSKGNRRVYFWKATISERTLRELEQQGYKVEQSTIYDGSPCITVSW